MKLRKGSKPYKILKAVSLGGGFLIISTISPLSGAIIVRGLVKNYFRKKRFERYHFFNDLQGLRNRRFINYREQKNGRVKILLTKEGRQKLLTYQIDEMQLKKPKRWDKKWRLVMFDIPHSHRKARDSFRGKLKNLKFYPLQKSVFITPYPCEDEIDFLTSIFNVKRYVILLYVNHFEGEKRLKHHFRIQ